MKVIVYDQKREENIRKGDLGRVLKVVGRFFKSINQTKKENRPTALNALREIRRRIKENYPK